MRKLLFYKATALKQGGPILDEKPTHDVAYNLSYILSLIY